MCCPLCVCMCVCVGLGQQNLTLLSTQTLKVTTKTTELDIWIALESGVDGVDVDDTRSVTHSDTCWHNKIHHYSHCKTTGNLHERLSDC